MAKINFTKKHFERLKELAFNMLVNNFTICTKMGQPLNIVELMHTQTINTLTSIRINLKKQIEGLEELDEWSITDYQQDKLEFLKEQKELVNLIIGWKKFKTEIEENTRKKKELEEQLYKLKESQKTPEDKIKEIEAKLQNIESINDF